VIPGRYEVSTPLLPSLLAFAADRRAAVDMDRRRAVQQSVDTAGPTAANPLHATAAAQDGTDGRTPYHYIDPAAYCVLMHYESICAASIPPCCEEKLLRNVSY